MTVKTVMTSHEKTTSVNLKRSQLSMAFGFLCLMLRYRKKSGKLMNFSIFLKTHNVYENQKF